MQMEALELRHALTDFLNDVMAQDHPWFSVLTLLRDHSLARDKLSDAMRGFRAVEGSRGGVVGVLGKYSVNGQGFVCGEGGCGRTFNSVRTLIFLGAADGC
jgi:hypothetical protein